MLDFNTKKRILKKLSDCGKKNFLMLLPCFIAAAFVKLYYFIGCSLGIAFSDKEGNFLGIKKAHKEKAPKARKQDDIVYVKRPLSSRLVSAVLAAAFAVMFIPAGLPGIISFAVTGYENVANDPTIEYGINDESRNYYYNPNAGSGKFGNPPEIEDDLTVAGYGCIRAAWKFNQTGLPTEGDGMFYSLEIHCDAVYDDETVIPGYESTPITIRQSAYDIGSGVGARTIPNLNPEMKYKVYAVAKQLVYVYGISKDDDIADYVYNNENGQLEKTDPVTGKTTRAKRDRVYRSYTSDCKVLSPNKKLPNPNQGGNLLTVQYESSDGHNTIKLDPSLFAASAKEVTDSSNATLTVQGYYVYRSTDITNKSGTVNATEYTRIRELELNPLNPVLEFDDGPPTKDTTRYNYVLCSYGTAFEGAPITSELPSGKQADGLTPVPVFTKTATPSLSVLNSNTFFTIEWPTMDGVTYYRLKRSDADGSNQVILDDNIPNSTDDRITYQDKSVVVGTSYKYTLYATNGRNTGRANDGEREAVSKTVTSPKLSPVINVPVITDIVSSPTNNSAVIKWDCIGEDISGFDFQVFRVDTDEDGKPDSNGDILLIPNDPIAATITKNLTNVRIEAANPVPGAGGIVSYQTTAYGFEMGKTYLIQARSYMQVGGSSTKKPKSVWFPDPGYFIKIGTDIYPPQEIEAVSASKQITVNWSKVDGAHHYILEIYKVNPGSIFIQDVGTKIVTGTSYTHTGLKDGDTYVYRVRAVRKLLGMEDESKPSDYVMATVGTIPFVPTDLTVEPSGNDLLIKWKKPSPAPDGYLLEIKYNGRTETKDVTSEQYLQRNPQFGVTYTYRVRAYKNISFPDGTVPIKYLSQYSNEEYYTIGGSINPPAGISAVAGDGEIKVSWQAVADAEGYILYATCDGVTETINVSNSTSFTHTGLVPGKTYTYYVVAFKHVNGTTIYSGPSATARATVGGMLSKPIDFEVVSADTSATLKWTAVAGAAGYTVYGVSNTGKILELDISKTTYTHTGLQTGEVWTYHVRAYRMVNGSKVYSETTNMCTVTIGSSLPAPADFTVTPSESSAVLSWTAVAAATGYTVYGVSDTGKTLEIDVSKNSYIHTRLETGEKWTYSIRAFRTVNNQKIYSAPTTSITVTIGMVLPAPPDLIATSGNRQVDLTWSDVKGADGYVVYVYDEGSASFLPLSIVSKPGYSHTGLKNGKRYTYMVAAYKNLNNERTIGDYSLAVSAIPSSGSASDVDVIINIKGTAPYGISHSEMITAGANHEAFDEPVDAYVSISNEATRAVKQVLRNYAGGLKSFIIYPFDIKTYRENTLVEIAPNDGFTITFTIPVPDKMVKYRDYITVIHLKDDGTDTLYDDEDDEIFVSSNEFEVLPSAIVQINGIWCVQFQTTSCSPFAFVIYRDNLSDVSAGSSSSSSGSTSSGFNTGILLFTALPDILPAEKKTRYVISTKKRYKIKKQDK